MSSTDAGSVPKWKLLQRGKYSPRYGKPFLGSESKIKRGASHPQFCTNIYPILGNKAWLKNQYCDQKKTMADIAREIRSTGDNKCTPKAVRRALEYHGIKKRKDPE